MEDIINRQACFACTTPYQVIGAINIAKKLHLDADLYVFGMFDGYETVAQKIYKHQIFRNVTAVDSVKYFHPTKYKALFQMIFSGRETSGFLQKNIVYEYFYTSSRAHIKQLFLHELTKRNRNLKIVMYDDGLGTYQSSSTMLNSSKKRRVAESIFGWKSFSSGRTSILVTMPELIELPDLLKNVNIERMPPIEWTDTNREMLLDIFSVGKEDFISEKVIIFDTVRAVYDNDLDIDLNALDDCYKLADDLCKHDIVCKSHPRSKGETTSGIKLYKKSGIPIEVLYAGMKDLENRILIGNCSTAVYTAKLLFGKEPIIIDLYRMANKKENEIAKSLFYKFKGIYDKKDRIFSPASMEELGEIFYRILN